jgi:hypothetical protein
VAKAAKVVGVLRWAEETKVAVVPGSGCEVHHLLDGLCLLQDLEGCFPGHY